MTPETRAAAKAIAEFLALWDAAPVHRTAYRDTISHQLSGDPDRGRRLLASDLRTLLAALDPDEQTSATGRCPNCAGWIYLDEGGRIGFHPVMRQTATQQPGMETCEGAGRKPATTATRHRPLTDEPCGVIPTDVGLDYLAMRREQHPKAAER